MILVDATTLLSLGKIGELELLLHFNGKPAVLPSVDEEVTT
jgi:predicted nucleic acid-binding protein